MKSAEKLRSQVRGTVPERSSPGQRERRGIRLQQKSMPNAHVITLRTTWPDSDPFEPISPIKRRHKIGKKVHIGQVQG